MTISLSQQDFDELQQESWRNRVNFDDFDSLWQWSNQLGKGYERWIELRPGLNFFIYDYEPLDHIILDAPPAESYIHHISFFVKGNVRTNLRGLVGYVDEDTDKNYLCHVPELWETEEWSAGQRILRVKLHLEPTNFFKTFSIADLAQLPLELRQTVERGTQPYYHLATTTGAMQVVLQQVLYCPYQGLTKKMYLEGKALELMTLQFTQLLAGNETKSHFILRTEDIDRIHHAKEILVNNLDNPPSLLELAKLVGLNDYKLKRGFRQVFGTTVFGHLYNYRMELARQMLETSQIKIREAARTVGYASQSSFNAAFKRKFGINPKSYQMGRQKKEI